MERASFSVVELLRNRKITRRVTRITRRVIFVTRRVVGAKRRVAKISFGVIKNASPYKKYSQWLIKIVQKLSIFRHSWVCFTIPADVSTTKFGLPKSCFTVKGWKSALIRWRPLFLFAELLCFHCNLLIFSVVTMKDAASFGDLIHEKEPKKYQEMMLATHMKFQPFNICFIVTLQKISVLRWNTGSGWNHVKWWHKLLYVFWVLG